MKIKTPEQIAREAWQSKIGTASGPWAESVIATTAAAIEADRAQRQPEIYIVQNDAGDVVDAFRDADEATAAYQDGYSVVEETIWETGEYSHERIIELTQEWEEATDSIASDYMLSEDDWSVGLNEDDAAEIARLIEWRKDHVK